MPRWLTRYWYYSRSIWQLLRGFDNQVRVTRIFTGLAGEGVKTIRVRRADVCFKVRGAMDVWSIKETFLDRFYERYGFAIEPGWTVFDIGGGIGEFGLFVACAEPSTQVFAFEPFPESFALMQENVRLNGVTNIRLHDTALGAESGTLILDLSSGEPLHIQSQASAETSSGKRIEVTSLSLEDALALTEVDDLDLLKLDCEGAEYAILFGTDESVLERIHRIVMEFHDGFTDHAHTDLVPYLTAAGYVVRTFPNPVYPNLGYLCAIR